MIITPCSSDLGLDTSCDRYCDENLKPFTNSEWVKSSFDMSSSPPKLVEDLDLDYPNEGCMWKCTKGHVKVITESGVELCVLEGSPYALKYSS
jgi:hypothetical protein